MGLAPVEPELEPLPELPPAERAARLKAMLTDRMEAMLRRAEAGQPIEGRQVTALASLAQLAERIAPTPDGGSADAFAASVEARTRSDEELADALQSIDDRIVYLASQYAMEILVSQGVSEADAKRAVSDRFS